MSLQAVFEDHFLRIAGWRRLFRAVMLSAIGLCAQSGDWAQVQALAPGAQVDVKRLSGGALVRGTVSSVSADALIIQTASDTLHVDRADARRVRLWSDERTKVGRITGAAIFAGLGIPIAMVSDGGGASRFASVPISAGVGYLIGRAFDRRKNVVLYMAARH